MTLKQRLLERAPLTGTWLTFASPNVAEALGHQGFDFLVVDTEHAPGDAMDVVAQLQAIGNTTAHPIVRVTELSTMLVKRAMDAGASTLLFPMIESASQAQAAVAAMRYPPSGVRGMAGIVRAAKFGADAAYTKTANGNACCIVQIESKAGLAAVHEIAAVQGVDCLFVGPADLSASLGVSARDDALFDALAKVSAAAKAHGKPCGIFTGDPAFARKSREMGYTLISLAADVMLLARGAKAFREAFEA
jgi:2-keto-3-deoxy-L-rhamnonate aldolase RhmA